MNNFLKNHKVDGGKSPEDDEEGKKGRKCNRNEEKNQRKQSGSR